MLLLLVVLKFAGIQILLISIIGIVLISFLFSKNNLFYLALFFIMLQEPLNIPFRKFAIDVMGSPIKFHYIFIGLAFLKWLFVKNKTSSAFRFYFKHKELLLLFVLTLIVSFVFSLNYGMRPAALLLILQAMVSVLLFFALPLFFKSPEDLHRFFLLISPIVIINLIGQSIVAVTKIEVFALFFGADLAYEDFTRMEVVRAVYSTFLSFFVFVYALFIITSTRGKKYKLKWYYILLSVFSFVSILISGTRSWSMAFGLILIGWLLISNLKKSIRAFFVGFLLIFLVSISPLSSQFGAAINRLETVYSVVEDISKGKETGESRWDERLPRMLEGYKLSPVWGLGMNNKGYEYSDGHVGLGTNLARFGIVGMSLLVFFWFRFSFRVFRASKNNKAVLMFFWGMLGLILIHSTGRSIFSFTDPSINMLFPIFLLYSYAHCRSNGKIFKNENFITLSSK